MQKPGKNYTPEEKAMLKEQFLVALRKTAGVLTPACEMVGVTRVTIWDWRKKDKTFDKACTECHEIALDLAESKLLQNIQNGDTTAIIFYLKTQGKARGYIEKQEVGLETKGIGLTVKVQDKDTAARLKKIQQG